MVYPGTPVSLRTLCSTLTAFRYDRSWGHLFESFAEFLSFSWPVVVVTDARTGNAHIVTRLGSVGAFVKVRMLRFYHRLGRYMLKRVHITQMIKTR